MGYSVGYSDGRWIGYGVPAECDFPDCRELIDRGMAYACESQWVYEDDEDNEGREVEADCGLYFCVSHRYSHGEKDHELVQPKDEFPGWMLFQLTDDSWSEWRGENPLVVSRYQKVLSDPLVLSGAQAFVDQERGSDDESIEVEDDQEEVQERQG